jgi:hypothetical protein
MRDALSAYLVDPPGKVVTIAPMPGGAFRVDPPQGADELSRTFFSKSEAFAHARELWTEHRCGLSDLTENMNNRR